MILPEEYSDLHIQKENSRYWYFLCPFHDDHNPSMIVNKSGQWAGYFRCWVCDENGSPRSFARRMGNEPSKSCLIKPKKNIKKPSDKIRSKKDFAALNKKFQNVLAFEQWEKFATNLGIERQFFDRLGLGYALVYRKDKKVKEWASSFPMYDENRNVVGIRFRFADGKKLSEIESTTGLFLDERRYDPNSPILLCEGVTDCAAALAFDFQAIGRPSANTKMALICNYLTKHGFRCPIIVADNDYPGTKGAFQLGDMLTKKGFLTKVINPLNPYKDLRDWFIHGGQAKDVWQLINHTRAIVPVKVKILRTPKMKQQITFSLGN